MKKMSFFFIFLFIHLLLLAPMHVDYQDYNWALMYDGPSNSIDSARSIAVDSQGNVYVTGESEGQGTYYDYATIAYDNSGNQL